MVSFIKKQFLDIKNGGIIVLKNKFGIISNHFIWFPLYIINLPLIFIIKFIGIFIVIRFEKLKSAFIGDVTQAVELYLCERENNINTLKTKTIDIFFPEGEICNKYLFKVFRRNIIILPKFLIFPLYVLCKYLPGLHHHIIGNNSQSDRDIKNLFDKTNVFFKLNEDEIKQGKTFLDSIGLSKNAKFICLNVREGAYHKDKKFHNYRNGDVNKFLSGCEELTKLGYHIFRMGSKPVAKLRSKNKMIIDYASNGMRTEFLDLFLGNQCEFCISTSSGFDSIPIVSRKPMLFITVPVGYFYTFSKNYMTITKHHYDKNIGRKLTIEEIFKRNVGFSLNSEEFKNNDILLEHNSEDELKNLFIEFHERFFKGIKFQNEDELSKKFWNMYNKYTENFYRNNAPLHGLFKSKVPSIYLNDNYYL